MISITTHAPRLAAAGALLLALSACGQQVETAEVASELPPAAAPDHGVGTTFTLVASDGDARTSEIVAREDGLVTMQSSEGCLWTRHADGFGPSLRFENCGGSTGTQDVEREGRLFPLEVGRTENWQAAGRTEAGETWRTERRCEVEGTARVSVPAGTFDTYHVVCEDDWNQWERWYAPELRASVIYKRRRKNRGGEGDYWELAEIEPASA
ncbi:MAG: hypothetical protein ACQEUZ_16635 [Pseudomonadota bacterium]